MARTHPKDSGAGQRRDTGVAIDAIEASLRALGCRVKPDIDEEIYKGYCRKKQCAPTNTQLAEATGIDTRVLHYNLKRMMRCGRVGKVRGQYVPIVNQPRGGCGVGGD